MEIRKGIPASPGIAIREAFVLDAEGVRIARHSVSTDEVPGEVERLGRAFEKARQEVMDLSQSVSQSIDPQVGEILLAHVGMLQDANFRKEFLDYIRHEQVSAELAVARVMRRWRRIFQENDFLASRISDIDDIERRLLLILVEENKELIDSLQNEVVIVAHDLGPSQTASLDTERVKAFATDRGGPASHTAIVARALGIPAVVGLQNITSEVDGGDILIIDGHTGVVIIEPDEDTLNEYRRRQSDEARKDQALLEELRDLPSETPDGCRVSILGNIEFPKEVPGCLDRGAEGIGLYRTEFLYLAEEKLPTEHDHFRAYMKALNHLQGRPITIRTLDLGADKFGVPDAGAERNPFLGCRSIRYCLANPALLRNQLRAVLRAATFGKVKVMFPMISSLEEIKTAKAILTEVRGELEREGVEHDPNIEIGAMIEVPSAVLIADALAQEVSFFSIGTNDLIQYTLAVDRGNQCVAHMYTPAHPAVLRLIKQAIDAANRHGIDVGVCGEMGGDVAFTILRIGMGIRQLSVAPASVIPEIKKVIRSVSYSKAMELADQVLAMNDSTEIVSCIQSANKTFLPALFGAQ